MKPAYRVHQYNNKSWYLWHKHFLRNSLRGLLFFITIRKWFTASVRETEAILAFNVMDEISPFEMPAVSPAIELATFRKHRLLDVRLQMLQTPCFVEFIISLLIFYADRNTLQIKRGIAKGTKSDWSFREQIYFPSTNPKWRWKPRNVIPQSALPIAYLHISHQSFTFNKPSRFKVTFRNHGPINILLSSYYSNSITVKVISIGIPNCL